MKRAILIYILFYGLVIFGYGRCIYKLCNSDFKATYRAEVIYGIGTCTGLGVFIGYLDIDDK